MSEPLHVREYGEGRAVVLLHAFPCSGAMWTPQAEALAVAGFRVLVPDLPGFGGSALRTDDPSLESIASDVLIMLADRGITRAVVGGVSLGGYVAMALARIRPEVLDALILCDTKATADSAAARDNRERLARLCEESPAETPRILEQAVLPGLLGETTFATRPEVVGTVTTWLGEARSDAVAWYQRAMAVRPDSTAALQRLEVPALIVWGEQDALSSRAEQDIMLNSLAGARLATVEAAGHLANVERPEFVSAALVEFALTV